MVSVLRTLQAEWNSLVPAAQAAGIRRVRTLNLPLETIAYRRERLDWLRQQLAQSMTTTAPFAPFDLSVLTFGVELEFLLPRGRNHGDVAEHLARSTNIPCTNLPYTHGSIGTWKIVTDGSLSDYARGAELVSPVLQGEAGFAQVQAMCAVLERIGCKVSKKCGLHVHVGARNWSVDTFRNLISLYHSAEGAIDSFLAPSRRASNNSFCRPLEIDYRVLERATTVDEVARASGQHPGAQNVRGGGRYRKLNLQSFWQHGTVEFRHHQGTIEGKKVINWTRLCLRLALAAIEGTRMAQSFNALMDAAKVPEDEKSYFEQRRAFFEAQLARTVRNNASMMRDEPVRSSQERREEFRQVDLTFVEERREAYGAMTTRSPSVRSVTLNVSTAANPFSAAGEELVQRSRTPGQE